MSDSRQQWLKVLTGLGKKEPEKNVKCPYCDKRFTNEQGLLGHWSGVHKRYGKARPLLDLDAEVERDNADPKENLRRAQVKGRSSGNRKHRTLEECEEFIERYDQALLTMSSKEYEKQTGITKQKVSQVRKRLKKLQESKK